MEDDYQIAHRPVSNVERVYEDGDRGYIAPNELRERVKDRVKAIDRNYILLGRDLFMVFNRKLFIDWGYATFGEYLEKDAGITKRRAERTRQIWRIMVKELGVKQSDLEDIQYSSALQIIRVAKRGDVGDWMHKARQLSVRDLKREVDRKIKADRNDALLISSDLNGDSHIIAPPEDPLIDFADEDLPDVVNGNLDEPEDLIKTTFYLYETQARVVEAALNEAELEANSRKPGHLLTCICSDYLSGRMSDDTKERGRLNFHLSNLKMNYLKPDEAIIIIKGVKGIEKLNQFLEDNPDLFGITDGNRG